MKLAESACVTVRLADGASVTGHVELSDEQHVTLSLTAASDGPLSARGSDVVIECSTATGIHRIGGRVVEASPDPDVMVVRRDGDHDVVQRRDFARVDCIVDATVRTIGAERGTVIRTTTRNLSAKGVLLHDPLGLPVGTEVEVELVLARLSPPVHAVGAVVREVGREVRGVELLQIAHGERERLVRFVLQRQRLEVRIARNR